MMNLTDSAKNHFLNFFKKSERKSSDGIEQFCKAEYGKDWKFALNTYLKDGIFPNSIRQTL